MYTEWSGLIVSMLVCGKILHKDFKPGICEMSFIEIPRYKKHDFYSRTNLFIEIIIFFRYPYQTHSFGSRWQLYSVYLWKKNWTGR